jgi:hypothetical protein
MLNCVLVSSISLTYCASDPGDDNSQLTAAQADGERERDAFSHWPGATIAGECDRVNISLDQVSDCCMYGRQIPAIAMSL